MPLASMAFHARRIADGVRGYGLRYLLRAPANELRNPRLAMTAAVRRALIAAVELVRPPGMNGVMCPDDCLLFAFDLDASPVTFDFATFLAGAEVERRRRGLDGIFVIFIPGSREGLREELPGYEAAINPAQRQWRVRHVLIPMLTLLPSVRGYTFCATREQAAKEIPPRHGALVPQDFRVWLPRQPDKRLVHDAAAAGVAIWPMLSTTSIAREIASRFLDSVCRGRLSVVITIRASASAPARNSNVAEWRAFVDGLDRQRFAAIFVLDAEAAVADVPPELAGETFCEAARWNLEIRMALYDAAWLNMAVMQGPMELCWYNERARYLVFLEVGRDPGSSARVIEEGGVRVGQDLGFATPLQHIVWQGDRASVIREAFDAMTARIEAAQLRPLRHE
jgi:hypothetical protein